MRDKVSNNPAYVAALAGAAAIVLVIGYWLKPAVPDSESTVSEQERSRLEYLLRREALAATSDSLAAVANGLFAKIVRVEEVGSGGVAWVQDNKVLLLTPPVAPADTHVLSAAGKRSTAPPWTTPGGDLPFAAFQVPAGSEVPVSKLANIQRMRVGQWLFAVWRNPDGRAGFVAGSYGGVRVAECGNYVLREILTSIPLMAATSGGIFDVDGNLVAVPAPCGGRRIALSVDSVHALLADANSLENRIERRFGIQLSPLGTLAEEYFRVKDGLLISSVISGTPADQAGLVPGDVLLSMSGQPVRALEDIDKHLTAGDAKQIDLRLVRRGRTIAARLPADGLPQPAGVMFASEPAGVPIESVMPESAASKAGIQAGDRVLTIDGAVFRSQSSGADALVRRDHPAYVVLQRKSQKLGVFLENK